MRWCRRRDSNSHSFRHYPLKIACLPISPRRRHSIRCFGRHEEVACRATANSSRGARYFCGMAAAPDADVGAAEAAEAAMAGTTIAAPGMAAAPEAETAGADAVVEG